MSLNNQNPFLEQPRVSQTSNASKKIIPIYNPNLTPLNQTSIINSKQPTPIIQPNSYEPNLSLNSKPNTLNKISINFSFNPPKRENKEVINKTSNIQQISNETNKVQNINQGTTYKMLIKRIALQLKKKVRQPTHGFFYFALLKGSYPLLVIKKIQTRIVNHDIDLNNELFRIYSEKYLRYKQLVKKIALLLKRNMKNKMFWENERYNQLNNNINTTNQTIQVKVTEKNKSHGYNNTQINQKKNNNIKNNVQTKKEINVKNIKTIQTRKGTTTSHINTNTVVNKKIKSHAAKINNNINNIHSTSQIRSNVSHRLNNVVNPFSVAGKVQIQKKSNLTKNNKSVKSNKTNNNLKQQNLSESSDNNKQAKLTLNNINTNQERSQIIKINKITTKTEINSNNNDIEMKDETNLNNNDTVQNSNDIIINKAKNAFLNMKIIPQDKRMTIDINNNTIQTEELNKAPLINNSTAQNLLNEQNNSSKKAKIKLTAFKKSDILPYSNQPINHNTNNNITSSQQKQKFNLSEININLDNINDNITDEQVSYVNKFNVFLSNNGIILENNIPVSCDSNGQDIMKKTVFWEKYLYYLYLSYLINKIKISIFTFIHLIEQYFLWCESPSSETSLNYKTNIINFITKIFSEKDIYQFLAMNKIDNLNALFAKYEVFMRYTNRDYYKRNKEIELKIDNDSDCNCELCRSDIACMKKIGEMNKKLNTNVSVENLLIKGEKNNKKEKNEFKKANNNQIIFEGKNKSGIFSKSKTNYSFESVFQYLPNQLKIEEENDDIKENTNSKKNKKKTKSKSRSRKKSTTKKSKSKKEKEDKDDKFTDKKMDEYLLKEEEEDKYLDLADIIDSINKEKNKGRKKSAKNKKRNSYKNSEDSDNESEEEIIKEKEKAKKKKKSKTVRRNKSVDRKIHDTEGETGSESDEEDEDIHKKKRNAQYPKVGKKKGKK